MKNTRAICFVFMCYIYIIESFLITQYKVKESKRPPTQMISLLRSEEGIKNTSVPIGAAASSDIGNDDSFKTRFKRESKLAEASKTSNLKTMHTFFQLIRNFWSPTPLGGNHPMHPDTIKPAMRIFRAGVYDFFFPPASKMEESAA